jgi:putative ABC transport system permease protein
MTLPGFILRNALRNKRRSAITLCSVATGLFLLTGLQVLRRGFTNPTMTEQSAARIVVRHKVSLANMLFSKYQARLERMPGVAACTKLVWFGGIYRDERDFFPQFACDAKSLFQVVTEAKIDPDQLRQFIQERTACVVGVRTMERFGWKLGDRITLLGAMWPCNPELTIRGVFSGSIDDTNLFFHHEYFDELLGDRGFTGLFWIRAERLESVPELMERIDAEFSNSDAETKTETERSFQVGFVSMLGNVRMLIGSISTVIVFTLLLVVGSTMSMALRERVREIAILKGLGYRNLQLFLFMLAESLGLALVGGLLGSLSASFLLGVLHAQDLSHGLFVTFDVTPRILLQSLLLSSVLGGLSCLLPAWTNLRRSVVDGLRTPD